MITQYVLKEYVRYDSATGYFFSVKSGVKYTATDKDGYVKIRIEKTIYSAARLAFLYMTGNMPKQTVDHIDKIKDNNSWVNLRDVSMSKNKMNMELPRKDSTSGYLGVSYHKRTKKYQAGIKVNGIRKQIGYFENPELAHKAYLKEKSILHII